MSVLLKVWGDYACFSRPELTERYSYDVMTPSAAIGILEAIFWHPGVHYKIDKIYVVNPIEFITIWKNEVNSKIKDNEIKKAFNDPASAYINANTKTTIVQRSYTVLKDVCYIIKAHFHIGKEANETDNPNKFQDILTRRIKKGQCFHRPYFGIREFPVRFEMWDKSEREIKTIEETRDLGIMLYKMKYNSEEAKDNTTDDKIQPTFFRAKLENGVLDLKNCEVLK